MSNAPIFPGPYAQGNSPHAPYRAQAPVPGLSPIGHNTRWIFAAIVSVMMLAFGAAVCSWTAAFVSADRAGAGAPPDDTMLKVGLISFIAIIVLLYGQVAAALVWVYKAWSWLPWDQRYTRHWRNWLTPSHVALMLLIPYFHYYWMFVANVGLCDALDRMRVSYPTQKPSPKNLAIAACICQLVVPFPIASILWFVFMSRIERMTREMSVTMAPRMHAAF